MNTISFAGVVLAGGKSRRLGTDKAELILPGHSQTLLEGALGLLAELTPEIYISGRNVPGKACLPDMPVGQAALRGVYSALKTLKKPCLIIACDMPNLTASVLRALVEKPCPGITCYVHNGWVEPLAALYTPIILPHLEAAAALGNFSLRRAVPQHMIRALPCPDSVAACFTNINTPEDLAKNSNP